DRAAGLVLQLRHPLHHHADAGVDAVGRRAALLRSGRFRDGRLRSGRFLCRLLLGGGLGHGSLSGNLYWPLRSSAFTYWICPAWYRSWAMMPWMMARFVTLLPGGVFFRSAGFSAAMAAR